VITTGAKLYFGFAALAAAAAVVFSWGSHGGLTGALTGGFYGGMGDHTGYVVLLTTALVALFVGGLVIAFRDADADALRAVARTEEAPEVPAPHHASYWPILGAAAAGCIIVGLVSSTLLFVFGVVVAIVVLLEWMVSSWSDRATGDPEVNRRIRNRLMNPIEIPLFGAIAIFAFVLAVSRVLLASSEHGSAIAAIAIAILILASASIYAAAPKAGRTIVAVLCVLAALGVITGGIISAAEGSRTYEKHEADHTSAHPDRRQPETPTTEEQPAASSSSEAN
jgi:hypothetical protein